MAAPLEKAVAIPAEGPTLDGIFLRGRGEGDPFAGAVIAPPHPLYGGSMDNPVVSELAYALCAAGVASLRFNWRGVGASEGAPSGDPAEADADYAAALAHLAATLPGPLAACGYSFGAAAAVRAASAERVRRLVLVAPPPSLCDFVALARFAGRVLVVVGGRDAIAPAEALRVRVPPRPEAELVVIAEADHFFGTGLAALHRAVLASWQR